MRVLARALEASGRTCIAPTMPVRSGAAPIHKLAAWLANYVSDNVEGAFDLCGFSMGALVSRTYVQQHGGHTRVQRFVSISGPHHGSRWAKLLPLAGARDMRPESALLQSLGAQPNPWGTTQVHAVWTPFDITIFPPSSSALPHTSSSQTFPVLLHDAMVRNERVVKHVVELLSTPESCWERRRRSPTRSCR